MNWNSLVVIVCVIVAALAVRKEFIRINKACLILRVLAVLIAAAALAGIALPITYQANVPQQDIYEAVLLTPGFNADSLNKYNNSKLFTLDKVIKNSKAKFLSSIDQLTADSTITQLRILGNGLSEDQLKQLNHLPIIFNPEEFKRGITVISWNEKLKTGDELTIQGTYKNSSAQKIKLLLKGLATDLDSTFVESGTTAAFHLKSTPKVLGRAVFNLIIIAGADTLEKENLPIQIAAVKPLNILMLMASPDFESRFLKNWLSGNGYGVAVRSAISKDKFGTELINLPRLSLDHLSAQIINKFDVLIADLSVLKSLSNQEATTLRSEVTQNGMCVIIKADSTLRSDSWLQSNFPAVRLSGRDTISSSIFITGNNQKLAKLNNNLVGIKFQAGTQPLINDEHGHIRASGILAGSGKLIFTTLNNTFSWMLSGNRYDYSALWSLLISKAARKIPAGENWDVLTEIPSVLSPVNLQLQGSESNVLVDGRVVVSAQQNPLLPFENNYSFWPQSAGWQSIKTNTGSLGWFYIYGNDDWKSLRVLKKQLDTKNYMKKNVIMSNVTKQIHGNVRNTVPKIYFYVLLLLTCTFLWAEAKVSQTISPSVKREEKK